MNWICATYGHDLWCDGYGTEVMWVQYGPWTCRRCGWVIGWGGR